MSKRLQSDIATLTNTQIDLHVFSSMCPQCVYMSSLIHDNDKNLKIDLKKPSPSLVLVRILSLKLHVN